MACAGTFAIVIDNLAMAETCPKCGYAQVETDQCPRCRVVVSQYRAYLQRLDQKPAAPSAGVEGTVAPAREEVVSGDRAGFWIRFVAVLVDGICLWVVGFVVRFVAARFVAGILSGGRAGERVVLILILMLPGALYYIIFHWKWGQTLGKMALRLRVVTVDGFPISLGTSVLRYFGYLLSALTLSIGYIMAGLRQDKRALHDLVAKTRVVRL